MSLNGKSVQQDEEDRVLWTETKCGKFSVKSLYKALEPGSTISFPSNIIWKSCAQPKVSFFGWEATWGRALTLDQIQKRGWLLANRCYIFQMHEESIDHILLHCAKTRTLWEMFFTLFGVQWVLPSSVRATLLGWNGSFMGKKKKGVWRVGPLCIFWMVWNARNRIAFEEDVLSIQRLKSSFVCFLWLETKLFIKYGPSTLVGFIDWLGSHWGWGLFLYLLVDSCFCSS